MNKDGPIYGKFRVERTDGKSAPGEKHDGCDYFVLDMTHDPFAVPAVLAYAKACRLTYPVLAADIERKYGDAPTDEDREASWAICQTYEENCGIADGWEQFLRDPIAKALSLARAEGVAAGRREGLLAALKAAEDDEMVQRFGERKQAEGEFGECVYRRPLSETIRSLLGEARL